VAEVFYYLLVVYFFNSDDDLLDNHYPTTPKVVCSALNHMKALFIKRLWLTVRNRKALFSQIVLPTVFVSISMTIALTAPRMTDPEPIEMSTAQFFKATQPKGNFVPFSVKFSEAMRTRRNVNKSDSDIFSERLAKTLFLPSGIGASCLLKGSEKQFIKSATEVSDHELVNIDSEQFEEMCKTYLKDRSSVAIQNINKMPVFGASYHLPTQNDTCYCRADNSWVTCEESFKAQHWQLPIGDVIQDVTPTVNNVYDYFLRTVDDYRRHR